MNPLFTTKRLRVFMAKITPDPAAQHMERSFFFACRTDTDCPMVVVSATCLMFDKPTFMCPNGEIYVEMIETNVLHRRDGLATELWQGIEDHYGRKLEGEAVTRLGQKFLKSLDD